MPPIGIFKIGFKVRVPKEENQCEGSNNSYEIPKCAWVIKLVPINNFFLPLFFFLSTLFSFFSSLFSAFLCFCFFFSPLDGTVWFELSCSTINVDITYDTLPFPGQIRCSYERQALQRLKWVPIHNLSGLTKVMMQVTKEASYLKHVI